MQETLWQDENEFLKVTVFADVSADILHKPSGAAWRMGSVALQEEGPIDDGRVWQRTERSMCEQYPGRFRGRRRGMRVEFEVLDRLGNPAGAFLAAYRLAGDAWEVSVQEIGDSLQSLVFPPPIESASLVLPRHEGKWIRRPMDKRFFWRFVCHLNMRWFGGLDETADRGWMAIFTDGWENGGAMATSLHVSPAWTRSLGQWRGSGPRTIRYQFPTGGYVGMAKAFRRWAEQHDLIRTLAEKIDRTPCLENLARGRMMSFMQARPFRRSRLEDRFLRVPTELADKPEGTVALVRHGDVKRIFAEAKGLGLKRAMLHLHGLFLGGYDEMHPDIWPPEPALGTLEELRENCRSSKGYFTCLHDNYQDIYAQSPSFPHGICQLEDGRLLAGGVWAGGQAYILNSRNGLEYLRRNWPNLRGLGTDAIYIDTLACEQLKQSFEPGNTLTRVQDEQYRMEIFRLVKEDGLVLGSENGCDFAAGLIDWAPNGPHHREAGVSVPLWSLVYHDCLVNVRGVDGARGPEDLHPRDAEMAELRLRCMENMLWGYAAVSWVRRAEEWPAYQPSFTESLFMDNWTARIGTDAMVHHRFLDDVGEVEQTQWSSGAVLTANFGPEPCCVDGVEVPANGYVEG